MGRRLLFHFVTAFLTVVVAGSAQNRDGASLAGRVSDESGGRLPGATIHLRNEATGHRYETLTGETGDFLFPALATGQYELAAELPGFSRLKVTGIRLSLNQAVHLPLVLKLGNPTIEIIVTSEQTPIETASAAVTRLIDGDEVKDFPFLASSWDGRNVLASLMRLTPGAANFDLVGTGGVATLSINGSPIAGVGFGLDGVDNTALGGIGGGALTAGPNPDALKEFSVQAHTFKAEEGVHPVVINMETRGGGNELHGMFRVLHLNPDLSARDFFDKARKSQYTTDTLGLQLSGPIHLPGFYNGRDRTLFLIDFEAMRSTQVLSTQVTVLSDAERIGNFAAVDSSRRPKDPLTGELFPNGLVPSSRVLPQSRKYVDELIPRATNGRQLFTQIRSIPEAKQGTARIDHQFSPRDSLNASLFTNSTRYNWPHPENVKGEDRYGTRGHNFSLRQTHSFSPRTTASFTIGRSYYLFDQGYEGKHNSLDLKKEGFNITRNVPGATGYPEALLFGTNYFAPGGGRWLFADTVWTIKGEFVQTRDAHALKLGGEARWLRSQSYDEWTVVPLFQFADFNPFGTGNEVADFLLGIPFRYRQGARTPSYPRRLHLSFYLQDDFKLRSNVTLNLGIRYEVAGAWSDREGRRTLFRPGAQSRVFPNAPSGMIFAGDIDPLSGEVLGSSFAPADRNNIAPRLGIAYSPSSTSGLARKLFGGQGKSSIRAGYGIYYIFSRPNAIGSLSSLPPWSLFAFRDATQIARSGGSFLNPWGSDRDPFMLATVERGFALPVWGVPSIDPGFQESYQQQWTISVERRLPREWSFSLTYLGNRATHLPQRYQINQGILTPTASPFDVQARRRYQDFGEVLGYASDGESMYHAFQAGVSRRFAQAFQLNGHYVWSKALDDAGSNSLFLFQFGDRDTATWARANFDRRHQFVLHGTWHLPGPARWKVLKVALSDWQLSGIVQLVSGAPLNIQNPFDSTMRGIEPGTPDITGPFQRLNPRQVRSFKLPNGQTVTGNFLFDPTVFRIVSPARPSEARPGNLGRNTFSAPGLANADLSILRRFRILERHRIDFRADITNALNHAQFLVTPRPAVITSFPFFAQTRGTAGPRRIQFYLRYSF